MDIIHTCRQGCISCGPCSCPELTEDHVLPSAYVEIFRTVTRNAVNKSVWRKKDCFWLPLNKHAMNIWLSSLRIRACVSWRTGKDLHVLQLLRTYSTCSYPGSHCAPCNTFGEQREIYEWIGLFFKPPWKQKSKICLLHSKTERRIHSKTAIFNRPIQGGLAHQKCYARVQPRHSVTCICTDIC